jgi:hypothetical protein
MGLASIENVPSSDQSLNEWSFSHQAHHRDVARRIYELHSLALPEYVIDPMNVNDLGLFGYQHQALHNDVNFVLGVSGNDLSEVNWHDPGEREGWIFLNFSEHQQWNQILGV